MVMRIGTFYFFNKEVTIHLIRYDSHKVVCELYHIVVHIIYFCE